MRLLAVVAVLVSAGVHLRLWWTGFKVLHVVGPAFMVNAVAGAVIAVMLLTWRHWLPALLTLGFGATTLGAFVVATTSNGLYGVHERWQGNYVWAGAISEAVAILAGGWLLLAAFRAGEVALRPGAHHAGHASGQPG
jgi:hypothetical protein